MLAISIHNASASSSDLGFRCDGIGISGAMPATLPISIELVSPMAEWRKDRFDTAQLADPMISGTGADPDGDRLPNLTEYAHGTDPLTADVSDRATGFDVLNLTPGLRIRPVLDLPDALPTDVVVELQTKPHLTVADWVTYAVRYPGLPRWAGPWVSDILEEGGAK